MLLYLIIYREITFKKVWAPKRDGVKTAGSNTLIVRTKDIEFFFSSGKTNKGKKCNGEMKNYPLQLKYLLRYDIPPEKRRNC